MLRIMDTDGFFLLVFMWFLVEVFLYIYSGHYITGVIFLDDIA